jgi:hypothetical protein
MNRALVKGTFVIFGIIVTLLVALTVSAIFVFIIVLRALPLERSQALLRRNTANSYEWELVVTNRWNKDKVVFAFVQEQTALGIQGVEELRPLTILIYANGETLPETITEEASDYAFWVHQFRSVIIEMAMKRLYELSRARPASQSTRGSGRVSFIN